MPIKVNAEHAWIISHVWPALIIVFGCEMSHNRTERGGILFVYVEPKPDHERSENTNLRILHFYIRLWDRGVCNTMGPIFTNSRGYYSRTNIFLKCPRSVALLSFYPSLPQSTSPFSSTSLLENLLVSSRDTPGCLPKQAMVNRH